MNKTLQSYWSILKEWTSIYIFPKTNITYFPENFIFTFLSFTSFSLRKGSHLTPINRTSFCLIYLGHIRHTWREIFLSPWSNIRYKEAIHQCVWYVNISEHGVLMWNSREVKKYGDNIYDLYIYMDVLTQCRHRMRGACKDTVVARNPQLIHLDHRSSGI